MKNSEFYRKSIFSIDIIDFSDILFWKSHVAFRKHKESHHVAQHP